MESIIEVPNVPGIYVIRNLLNGKVYIGSTVNLRVRKNNHLSSLRNHKHHNSHLQAAWNKYRENAFQFKILEQTRKDLDILRKREEYWIRHLNASAMGYNFKTEITKNEGVPRSLETRRKIGKTKKGVKINYHLSPEMSRIKSEMCRKQNLAQYHTKETELKRLRNLRKAVKGKPIGEEHKLSISRANRGENNSQAKLSAPIVKIIKRLLKANELSNEEIGKKFSVSRRAVSFIKYGKRWAHIQINKRISQEEITEIEKMVNI